MSDEQPVSDGLKSIREVAQETSIPESTLRYYDSEFGDYIDIRRDSADRRIFDEKCVRQILYIRRLLKKDGLSIKQVKDRLEMEKNLTAGGSHPISETALSALGDKISRIERQQDLLVKAVETTLKEVRTCQRLLDLNLTRLSLLFGPPERK